MSETTGKKLEEVIRATAEKIRKYRSRSIDIGEENTKATLIAPILQALGWDVRDFDEVEHEYKRTPRDKPVDYALKLFRQPRLFVEAKGLGENLSDRRWILQILGYATAAGVKWSVLTDGDEFRVYNAAATVPADQKLLCKVRISEDPAETVISALQLLSRDNLDGNLLETMWNSHFVDRQVRKALQGMFKSVDASLVKLIRKKVPKLKPKSISESVRRLDIRIESPSMSPLPATSPKKPVPVAAKTANRFALRRRFWEGLLERAKSRTELHSRCSATDSGWIWTGAGKAGFGYVYVIRKHDAHVEVCIGRADAKENKKVFDGFARMKSDIERAFGGPLEWQRLDGKRMCRIKKDIKGGGYLDQDKWPSVYEDMIGAMIRLEGAFRHYIKEVKL